ncbi:serine protease 27-like [Grus japonensis]|uniref:Serine protease 27-like n=2 Tax=Grus TaxID=9114 RepID=A0ABC9XYM7_GRUJA
MSPSPSPRRSRDPRVYAVLLGVRELSGPPGPGVVVPLGRLLPHPSYAGEATSGDIALAQLAWPVTFSDAVLPVCLPAPTLSFPPGTRCVATGWGDIQEGEDLPSPRRLQKLEVPIMAQSTCRRLYGIDMGRALPPRRIQDDMMCAGYAEGLKDTCKGDSGGPLVCRADGRWVLAGICFQVLGRVGQGSFGEVYKVRSLDDGRLYAIKRSLRPFRGPLDRLRRLSEAAKHRHVFSLGLTILELGVGKRLPEAGEGWQELRRGGLPHGAASGFSAELREVLGAMLEPDPRRRPTAEELLGWGSVKRAGRWRAVTRLADEGLRRLDDWLKGCWQTLRRLWGALWGRAPWLWAPATPPSSPLPPPLTPPSPWEEDDDDDDDDNDDDKAPPTPWGRGSRRCVGQRRGAERVPWGGCSPSPPRPLGARSPSPTGGLRRSLTFEEEPEEPNPPPK